MRFLLYLLPFLTQFGCNQQASDAETKMSSGETVKIEYATNFNLQKTAQGYTLEIIDPTTSKIEHSYDINNSNQYDVISLTATMNGMYSILAAHKHIKGISSIDYIYDPILQQRFKDKKIKSFGDETSHSIEKIISSNANTILYSGFGDEFPNQAKLEKLNFTIIPIYDWKEIHPLGKAEWIKIVGALTGKMNEANAFFKHVVSEYKALQKLAKNVEHRPTSISGNLIGDIWYTPASESYMAHLIKDAGSNYRYAKIKGGVTLEFSIEQIIKDNTKTEFWINPGYDSKAKIDKANPHAKFLNCYYNTYCYSPNMAKFWERSAAEPHYVLSDLIHIFHPEITEITSFNYYEKIN